MTLADIKREHIHSAIKEIDEVGEIPKRRKAVNFDLIYNGNIYPPKYVLSLAHKYVDGTELAWNNFKAREANKCFQSLKFSVVRKNDKKLNGKQTFEFV